MCIYELLVHMPRLALITGALLFSFNRLLGMLRVGMFLRLKQLARYSPLVLEGLMIEFSRLNKSEEPKDSYNISLCSSCWFSNFPGNYIGLLHVLGMSRQTFGKHTTPTDLSSRWECMVLICDYYYQELWWLELWFVRPSER